MKSQARKIKRMEARRQELLLEIEHRNRIWNAAMAGNPMARKYLSQGYRGIDEDTGFDGR